MRSEPRSLRTVARRFDIQVISHRRIAEREPVAAKVPEVGVAFWVIKLLTTATGEAAADYLAGVNIALAAVLGLAGFVLAMRWQLRAGTYIPAVYWFAVVMVAVFGTMGADAFHIVFGVSYLASTLLCGAALVVIFRVWYRVAGTLSIHSIVTRRREVFYWLAVLATFALGTAVGDLAATTFGLGFAGAVALFAVLITIPALAWWRFGLNAIAAFWTAYVLTRPLGASIADWLGKPPSFGHGLGYGDGAVAALGSVAIIALVGWAAWRRVGIQAPHLQAVLPGQQRLLYHFTSREALEQIRAAGALQPAAAAQVAGVPVGNGSPVVWLSDDPDPGTGDDHGLGSSAARGEDRRAVRLTVAVTGAMPWASWAYVQRLPRRVRQRIDQRGGGLSGRWWVTPLPVPQTCWVAVEVRAEQQHPSPSGSPGAARRPVDEPVATRS